MLAVGAVLDVKIGEVDQDDVARTGVYLLLAVVVAVVGDCQSQCYTAALLPWVGARVARGRELSTGSHRDPGQMVSNWENRDTLG